MFRSVERSPRSLLVPGCALSLILAACSEPKAPPPPWERPGAPSFPRVEAPESLEETARRIEDLLSRFGHDPDCYEIAEVGAEESQIREWVDYGPTGRLLAVRALDCGDGFDRFYTSYGALEWDLMSGVPTPWQSEVLDAAWDALVRAGEVRSPRKDYEFRVHERAFGVTFKRGGKVGSIPGLILTGLHVTLTSRELREYLEAAKSEPVILEAKPPEVFLDPETLEPIRLEDHIDAYLEQRP